MSLARALAVVVTFVWVGMATAISFLEAPLKFSAPGVTLQIGLGIGRLVFRVLNRIELVFAVILLTVIAVEAPATAAVVGYAVAFVMLAIQLAVVRPRLNRRSDAVLAGAEGPRSHAHYYYVGLEAIKVIALVTAGILLLSS